MDGNRIFAFNTQWWPWTFLRRISSNYRKTGRSYYLHEGHLTYQTSLRPTTCKISPRSQQQPDPPNPPHNSIIPHFLFPASTSSPLLHSHLDKLLHQNRDSIIRKKFRFTRRITPLASQCTSHRKSMHNSRTQKPSQNFAHISSLIRPLPQQFSLHPFAGPNAPDEK